MKLSNKRVHPIFFAIQGDSEWRSTDAEDFYRRLLRGVQYCSNPSQVRAQALTDNRDSSQPFGYRQFIVHWRLDQLGAQRSPVRDVRQGKPQFTDR